MAKNDPAHIVAGAGLLTGIFTKLNAAVMALGGTAEDLHRLTKPEGDAIVRAMAKVVIANPHLVQDVEELELSIRPYHCLKRMGVEKVGQLVEKSGEELLALPHMRQEDVEEIREALAQRRLALRRSSLVRN